MSTSAAAGAMMTEPTWKKFGARSPQYADVGERLYELWWKTSPPVYDFPERKRFSREEMDTLIDWMRHELKHKDYEIATRDEETKELKKQLMVG